LGCLVAALCFAQFLAASLDRFFLRFALARRRR
jgi:hypothetical protein